MEKNKINKKDFPPIWIWVVALLILVIASEMYIPIWRCTSGLMMVGCSFSRTYFYLSIFESIIVYLFVGTLYKNWREQQKGRVRIWEYFIIGTISLVWVAGGVLTNNNVLLFLAYPFITLNFLIASGAWKEFLLMFIH